MCQTPKTCPQGHVRVVRHKGNGRECAEHYKHAHEGMFIVLDMRGRQRTRRTPKTGPCGTCSGV